MKVELFRTPPSDFNSVCSAVGGYMMWRGKLLFLKRAVTEDFLGGYWCVPGGKCNDSESVIAAACREWQEETGITICQADVIVSEPVYVRYVGTFDFVWYQFAIKTRYAKKPTIALNDREHTTYSWITPRRATRLLLIPGQKELIRRRFLR